ncbi:hypothetical protein TUBRATIS_008820 [Tubulinosema ratisbonensis]|uniref:Uncharacterized protein n=1 Tax=Tubulinosema ratisbonensis TaxID=291195 RepID=A0A437ANC3_9MICR|nr:hypothetical protein TUBRATIS_008820 [Tubulinosema ratisbonensis]
MLFLFFITNFFSFISQTKINFLQSNLYESHLEIKNKEKTHNFLIILYPNCVLPVVTDRLLKLEKRENKILAFYYFKTKLNFSYFKVVKKICEMDCFIERGLVLKMYLVNNEGVEEFKFTDSYPVPDFTVPFIAFSTFGTILGLVFNFFVNK